MVNWPHNRFWMTPIAAPESGPLAADPMARSLPAGETTR